MKITIMTHYCTGTIKLYANTSNQIQAQLDLISKIQPNTKKQIPIPDIKPLLDNIQSTVIIITEILKKQRPIKHAENILTPLIYQRLINTYNTQHSREENKTILTISQIQLQINMQKQTTQAGITVQDGERTRAFALELSKKNNKWITTALEYG